MRSYETATTLLVKEINQNLVRRQLLSQKAAIKQQLAQLTGLSLMTISSIINEMINHNEVTEENTIPSNDGRPSMELFRDCIFRGLITPE